MMQIVLGILTCLVFVKGEYPECVHSDQTLHLKCEPTQVVTGKLYGGINDNFNTSIPCYRSEEDCLNMLLYDVDGNYCFWRQSECSIALQGGWIFCLRLVRPSYVFVKDFQCIEESSVVYIDSQGDHITMSTGVILSPNYPELYNPSVDVRKVISVGHAESLDLWSGPIEVIGSADYGCSLPTDDKIIITHGNSEKHYCGEESEKIQIELYGITNTTVTVRFVSSSTNSVGRGFKIDFIVSQIPEPTTEFTSTTALTVTPSTWLVTIVSIVVIFISL